MDIAMSCIASLPDRHLTAAFSSAYLDLQLALIVPDHQRALFSDPELMQELPQLSVALVSSHYFVPRIKQLYPRAVFVELESAEEFFSNGEPPADALLLSAEEGAAYAFRYPAYSIVIPGQGDIRIPAAYALPRGEQEWQQFIGNWIDLKQKDGSVDTLYEYWMGGGVTKNAAPRWSVIRNVLGWVD
jgi:hypothetical protein